MNNLGKMTAMQHIGNGKSKQTPYFKQGGVPVKERSASAMAMQGNNGE